MKVFSEQLNEIKVDGDGIPPMNNFVGTTIEFTLKNHHKRFCPVYVLDARLKYNIYGLPKLEPHSRAGIYLGHSLFHAG